MGGGGGGNPDPGKASGGGARSVMVYGCVNEWFRWLGYWVEGERVRGWGKGRRRRGLGRVGGKGEGEMGREGRRGMGLG